MADIKKNERIWELDLLRGACVALMIMDHAFYDLGFVFISQWFPGGGEGFIYSLCNFAGGFYWFHPLRAIIRAIVVGCFICVCGLCCAFSRSNTRRGLKLLAVALAITAVTAVMDAVFSYRDVFIIRFGILHLLAVSILIYELLRPAPRSLTLILGLLLAALGIYFNAHPLDWNGLVPFVLGLGQGSYSADYFPILPWLGWFLAGAALTGGLLYKERRSYFPDRGRAKALRPLYFLGRHALIAYVLHQPLVYGALWLLGKVSGL